MASVASYFYKLLKKKYKRSLRETLATLAKTCTLIARLSPFARGQRTIQARLKAEALKRVITLVKGESMPLPTLHMHGAKQCRARSKRTGNQCQNPAAFGMPVCRMHGARHPHTTLRGEAHPGYKHGHETLEAKAVRSSKLFELRRLEALMHLLGMTTSKKSPGRKPKCNQPAP